MSDIATDSNDASAAAPAAAVAAPEPLTKVFVGNLSFQTTEDALKEEFSVSGTVVSAHIITHGPRSLGYGFVEMSSEDEAKDAVEKLDKKEIDGRPVNVEVAKPRAEGAGANPTGGRGRTRRRRGRGGGGAGGADGAEGEGANNGGGGGRRRGGDRANRVPSETTLFVANLPFSVNDESLADIFKDLNLKSAHVAMKGHNRSKGFGFVEFNNSDDQQAALTKIDGTEVEGRALSVKIALADPAPAEGEGDAAAATDAAPATEAVAAE